jgi:hypothetical protein
MGQEIVVRFSSTESAFAALYDIDSSGRVTLLFPNKFSQDNHLKAGQIYTGDNWGLEANGVPGRDRLFMLVSKSNNILPGVASFIQNPNQSEIFVSKGVGIFGREIEGATKDSQPNAIGAALVEFFTAK